MKTKEENTYINEGLLTGMLIALMTGFSWMLCMLFGLLIGSCIKKKK